MLRKFIICTLLTVSYSFLNGLSCSNKFSVITSKNRNALLFPVSLRRTFSRKINKTTLNEASNDFADVESGPSKVAAGGINVSGEAPFEIRGFSLATAFLIAGIAVTAGSFAEYFSNGGAGLSGLGFVYGIPISLIGLALKYAEIPPVGVQTSPEAADLFEKKATATIKKIKSDVTRHRYGDEAHLDSTLKALGLVLPQSDYPKLKGLSENVAPNGELSFSMIFQSRATPYKTWVDEAKIKKYNTFFGPGVEASVQKISAEDRLVALTLTTVDLTKQNESVADVAPVPQIAEQ